MKTKIVHSETKSAWDVIGCDLGRKYKIARTDINNEILVTKRKNEALEHAEFISKCSNELYKEIKK